MEGPRPLSYTGRVNRLVPERARAGLPAAALLFTCALTVADARPARGQALGQSAIAEAGRESYLELCAACHGNDARGGGPQAASLATAPPDLTLIAQRRDGKFPMPELARYIDGRELPQSHGTREMPAWGEPLAGGVEDKDMAERIVRGQALEILVYLESIQR